MKLRPRVCPLCGASNGRIHVKANFDETCLDRFAFSSRKVPEFMHFQMVSCAVCDLLYVTPAPELEWVRRGYTGAGFDTSEESHWAARSYARELRGFAAQLPDRCAALDVGAGDGAFLEQLMEAGFAQVAGIEPSSAARQGAKPAVLPLIREGFFCATDWQDGSFALVSCFQTLEHVDDPAALATAAFRLLKPGGAFYAIAHNYRSLLAQTLGTRSPIYDIEHLQLNSPRSLKFMLEQAGFERALVRPLRNEYPLSYWVRLLPIPLLVKGKLLRGLVSTGIGRLVLPIRAGNLLAVGYRPRT